MATVNNINFEKHLNKNMFSLFLPFDATSHMLNAPVEDKKIFFKSFSYVVDRFQSVILASQVSQYNFAMCSYLERKSEPVEMIQLDGFVVKYSEPDPDNQGGKVFFDTVKGADVIAFAR